MDFWSVLFPKKCVRCRTFGSYLCSSCFTLLDYDAPLICAICGRRAVGGLTHPFCRGKYTIDGVFAALVFRGVCKKLIYQFKFQPHLKDLRQLMGDLMYEGLIQQEAFTRVSRKNAVLVPIPLSLHRERQRGYNQAYLLAEEMSKRIEVPLYLFLVRHKATKSQVGKTQEERRENIKDAFSAKEIGKIELKGKTVFLVDDVVTSGATMNEAAKVLKRAGAKHVYGLAFAHGN